ncbi:MAG: rod shape-determining protein, partial [Oscillospiraceae bacterium]|nr:rod shape-determining protein [Oscillospiraceae bacterium]
MGFKFFSSDLGIDLGTSNILINMDNNGVVIREPAVVAVDKNTGKVLQVGSAARNMLGRTPGNVVAMHPLKDGIISDYGMTVKMLQVLFNSTSKSNLFTPKPRVVISVPSCITEVEERTVINAALEAGARRVYLIEEPMAAALGANLDISGPKGHLVVDIGGGTTDIAVLSMNGVANSTSIKLAGDAFDEAIARYIRKKYGISIGKVTAEDIKIQIGSVCPRQPTSMSVRGRDAKSGV